MPAASSRIVALVTGLALAAVPGGAGAFGPPDSVEPDQAEPQPEPAEDAPATEGPEPEGSEGEELEVEVEEPDQGGSVSGGGMIGSGVARDDPNAKRAQSDLEGESLDEQAGVPERLPKLQAAGWWLVFGGVTLAAAGGVLGGVAETREDEAERLAYGFDLMTGMSTQYGPVADEWNQTLREGQAFQAAARGLVIAGAVVLVGGIGFFIADAVQRKRGREERPRVQVQPGPSGVLLRF